MSAFEHVCEPSFRDDNKKQETTSALGYLPNQRKKKRENENSNETLSESRRPFLSLTAVDYWPKLAGI